MNKFGGDLIKHKTSVFLVEDKTSQWSVWNVFLTSFLKRRADVLSHLKRLALVREGIPLADCRGHRYPLRPPLPPHYLVFSVTFCHTSHPSQSQLQTHASVMGPSSRAFYPHTRFCFLSHLSIIVDQFLGDTSGLAGVTRRSRSSLLTTLLNVSRLLRVWGSFWGWVGWLLNA